MIHVQGCLQQSQYYLPYLDRIKNWFQMPATIMPPYEVDESDILVYIRLGDYFSREKFSLTHQFYEDAIAMANPRKIFVATENPNHSYFDKLKNTTQYSCEEPRYWIC
jgi:hypothetical protein